MNAFEINNQVSGKYMGEVYTGKIVSVTKTSQVTYLTIKLDAAITVWAKGELTVLEVEIDDNGNSMGCIRYNVVVVAKGEAATEARERVAVKRAVRAGVPASFAQMIVTRYDMSKTHVTTVMTVILTQWQLAAKAA